MQLKLFSRFWIFLMVCLLAACSTAQNASLTMFKRAFDGHREQAVQFDPRFEYMRITRDGRVFYLLKAYTDNGVDVWYGGGGEALKFKDGRLAGAIGTLTEWRNVQIPDMPAWSELASSSDIYKWVRKRDLMPSYHYGISDDLALSNIQPPTDSQLAGWLPNSLIWLKEVDLSPLHRLPDARYAYDPVSKKVVYGDTCLTATFCFSWQSWPKNLQ